MQGVLVGERYRMAELLGAGGMGAVWSAHDVRLERDVAVKLVLPRFDGEDGAAAQARFEREVRITARLRHPNIVGVHDCGTHRDAGRSVPFVVMDLLPGRSLDAVLKSGQRPGVGQVVDWGVQVCRALAAAHHEGVVHRDIKPANLFLTRRADGTEAVVVLDFGIAAYLQGDHTQLTADGHMIGTAAYMAPEQAMGEAGRRSDAAVLLGGVAADRARVLGRDHPHTLTARHNHAYNLGEAGRYTEAAGLLEGVAADRARVLGTSHRLTVMSRRSQAVYAGKIRRFG
ncbi:protein kinase [Kitasatospora sp. NPDC101447]|uniref:serine/threonine-protein kinase n=1 Tax=Kitasatospora sp. NPDC101447 TaxID=3364102 RepID=UPI00382FC88E